jgi:hypothetical protein
MLKQNQVLRSDIVVVDVDYMSLIEGKTEKTLFYVLCVGWKLMKKCYRWRESLLD